MIRVDKGHVNISGEVIEMLTELGTLAAALHEMMCEKGISKGAAEKLIYGAVVAGICSKETFGKEENSIMETADEIVKKILKGEKDDE
jgi:hypothetical protein